MISKLFSFVFIPFFTLFVFWAIGWLWFATSIAGAKPYKQITTENIDAIVVLTGGNGRVQTGLDILAQQQPKKLFISGVNKDATKEDILKSANNISSNICCITLGYKSTDTISNATEVKDWVTQNNINSFYLVTSSYHMPRSVMEFKNVLPNTQITQHPVFSPDVIPWQKRFWILTFSEYNKTIIRWMYNLGN